MFSGDEVLEWNGRSLAHKSYDDVHDVIAESRTDAQVELRVSRMLTTPTAAAAAARGGGVGGPAAAAAAAAAAAGRPSVTVSDPLGHSAEALMLNPGLRGPSSGMPVGTRIQVGIKNQLIFLLSVRTYIVSVVPVA